MSEVLRSSSAKGISSKALGIRLRGCDGSPDEPIEGQKLTRGTQRLGHTQGI